MDLDGELEGAWQGRPRSVLYASTEDSWPRTIGPRLAAAGADLSRVHQLAVQHGDRLDTPVLPDDVERLADKIETGGYGHFNKAQVQDALTAISGSSAFRELDRSIFAFAREVDGGSDRRGERGTKH